MSNQSMLLPSLFTAVCLFAGCAGPAEEADKPSEALAAPQLSSGKGDFSGYVAKGVLTFKEAANDKLASPQELHGYLLSVRKGAKVRLEITQKGSSSGLDSVLFVYPPTASGGFADFPVALDDDSGWGRLSRLDHTFKQEGTHLVVVGSYLGLGKGAYRLAGKCLAADCSPPPPPVECHTEVLDGMKWCALEARMPEMPESLRPPTPVELVERCSEAELLAVTFDNLCAKPSPEAFCAAPFEDFAQGQAQLCGPKLLDWAVSTDCVFGATFSAISQNLSWYTAETGRRTIDVAAVVTPLEEAQVLAAVASSAAGEQTDLAAALAATDDDSVEQIQLWDLSQDRAFTAYQFHAGDTRLGLIFEAGSTQVAAKINDSFIEDCKALVGPAQQPCAQKSDCAEGLTCVGASPQTYNGRCVNAAKDYPGDSQFCGPGDENPCPADSGVGCAGTAFDGTGICLPLWTRGVFQDIAQSPIPDGPNGVLERTIDVSGLLTVSTDAKVRVFITHPDVSQLRISLLNSYGTEAVVYSGEATGSELFLEKAVGVPGDEMVNGTWTLRVKDIKKKNVGNLYNWVLWLGSRWD
jgi:hypothetical protein